MKQIITLFFALACFANQEPPHKSAEGEYCGFETRPGIHCQEGLSCDRQGSADIWGGVCRKPCHEDADCKRSQYCDKRPVVSFCLEF